MCSVNNSMELKMGQAKLRKQEIENLKQKLNQDFFYHGTTEANYEKIMRSGYLKVSSSTSNTQKAIFLCNSDMGASMMTAMRHVLPEGSKVKLFKIPASVIDKNKLKVSYHHNSNTLHEGVECFKYFGDICVVDNGTEVGTHTPKLKIPEGMKLVRQGNRVGLTYA